MDVQLAGLQGTAVPAIINDIKRGESKAILGCAGTGKSVLLEYIYANVVDQKCTSKTALTGTAAINIKGITLHSWAGIGNVTTTVEELITKIKNNKQSKERWQKIKTLMIDEISMLDADLFDKLHLIGCSIRNNSNQLFGGIQLITFGDFLQLCPPANDLKFVFTSKIWNKYFTLPKRINILTKIYRQIKDQEYIKILNEIRIGIYSPAAKKALSQCVGRKLNTILDPLILFATKAEVAQKNQECFSKLTSKQVTFIAIDSGDLMYKMDLQKNCPAETFITLRVGCEVMLVKNINLKKGLVNGLKGKLVRFIDTGGTAPVIKEVGRGTVPPYPDTQFSSKFWRPIVLFEKHTEEIMIDPEEWLSESDGEVKAKRIQLPLTLAYASTIHKSQSKTLPFAQVNPQKIFTEGQAYVALSRVETIDCLSLTHPLQSFHIKADKTAIEYMAGAAPLATPSQTTSSLDVNINCNSFNDYNNINKPKIENNNNNSTSISINEFLKNKYNNTGGWKGHSPSKKRNILLTNDQSFEKELLIMNLPVSKFSKKQ